MIDYSKHTFRSPQYRSVVQSAVTFFEGTPVLGYPITTSFNGTGVYGIYYKGNYPLYKKFLEDNALEFKRPIYIGKAVPFGWRAARSNLSNNETVSLSGRLRQHERSIQSCQDLDIKDFKYRFVILNDEETDLIGTLESTLIRKYRPLWNSVIDGFGNHDPGKGRYNQAISEWDVLHCGRSWAKKLSGSPPNLERIKEKIAKYFSLPFP
jgi:hypothetical protein